MLDRGMKASLLILLVMLFRLVFRKAPGWTKCALWLIVFVQLMIPFKIESSLSAYNYIPEGRPVNAYYEVSSEPSEMTVDIPAVSGYPDRQPLEDSEKKTQTGDSYIPLLMAIWSMGIIVMIACFVRSMIRIKLMIRTAVPLRDNIYLSDEVNSSFVSGLFRPRIYLSSSMDESGIEYVLAHERAHLKRGDQWWKLIGYLVMCIYWMNPLMWASYVLFCKDIERACDEKVIRDFGLEEKKAYSTALLGCSMQKKLVFAGPLSFGEVGVKERVKNVLGYKKPAVWLIALAVIVCIIVGVAFLTSAKPEYQIRITIPAGSGQGVFYSDEEICSGRSTLRLSCGDGLGDTLVSLLPVEVKEENAYDEGRYLTPGMTAEFTVEKGAWFKIGVMAENSTEEDIDVYVRVKNVDVRIECPAASEEETKNQTANSESAETEDQAANPESAEKIEVRMPGLDLNATTGADGSTIYYADKDKFYFGGYYGLFVYDMVDGRIAGGIDLEAIGCNHTQGEDACDIKVTKDGSKVLLHPLNSDRMYLYDVMSNTLQSDEYSLYENQYSGDEVGKYASYEDEGETRYVALVNDVTIGELGYTIDVMSFYCRIFEDESWYDSGEPGD